MPSKNNAYTVFVKLLKLLSHVGNVEYQNDIQSEDFAVINKQSFRHAANLYATLLMQLSKFNILLQNIQAKQEPRTFAVL